MGNPVNVVMSTAKNWFENANPVTIGKTFAAICMVGGGILVIALGNSTATAEADAVVETVKDMVDETPITDAVVETVEKMAEVVEEVAE